MTTWLWLSAILIYGAGDIALTILGIELGAIEANPIAREIAVTHGILPAMLAGKAFAFGFAAIASIWVHDGYEWVLPGILTAMGSVIVGWNSVVILSLYL